MVAAGLLAAGLAVLLYASSTVLQAYAARNSAARSAHTPGLRDLLAERTWVAGVVLLGLAFLAFVLSTRVLPLPMAEAIRGSYLIVAVLLGHAVFGTRPRGDETVGVLVALTGLAVFVGGGGERGRDEPVSGTAVVMALVLVAVILLAAATARSALRAGAAGVVEAVLGGVAFAVLDMGVRSLPDPLSLPALLGQATTWVGGAGALIGLVLYSRSASRTSVGVASTVLLLVNVVGASAWAALAFGDSVSVPAAALGLSLAAMLGGTVLVVRAAEPEPSAT